MIRRPCIEVVGARQHNLKNIHVAIPRAALTVVTGPSGSGKSSLAFDTIFAEGQRRYVESLSNYARQFLQQLQKPEVDRIEGLPPTLAVDQGSSAAGPRSTVATSTEIHDFLRVLYARVGEPRCWKCDHLIERRSITQIVDAVLALPAGRRVMLLAPLLDGRRGSHRALLDRMIREGFVRARIDGEIVLLEEIEELDPKRKHRIDIVVDRLTIKPEIAQRLADSVETATSLAQGRVVVTSETADGSWSDQAWSVTLACPNHPEVRMDDLTPQMFSFNSPHGACPCCTGIGTTSEFDRDLIVPDPNLTLAQGAIAPWARPGQGLLKAFAPLLKEFCDCFAVDANIPFVQLDPSSTQILLDGTSPADPASTQRSFEGVIPNLQLRWENAETEKDKNRLRKYLTEKTCAVCSGTRLGVEARSVKIADRNIADFTSLTVRDADDVIAQWTFSGDRRGVAEPLVAEIQHRLKFLNQVGVDYLTLDRPSQTLSGGEWQRIRLATQIGTGLAGVCYVLDEPTIGLHARDTQRLISILQQLADLDNTVIVVEHDEEVISCARHVIDMGPGAGDAGGEVIVQGTLDQLRACEHSLTARFLTGRSTAAARRERRELDPKKFVELRGVSANNLRHIDVRFSLGGLVCVTGVSGSGKSTLVTQVLLRALRRRIERTGPKPGPYERIVGSHHVDRVIDVDQSPIGRTPRSNPATFVGAFDLIRKLYAKTREAKIRGYSPARFSFNVKGGRCELCEGQGIKRVNMHFLPDVYVTCTQCHGTRYNRETLDVRYRGKTIADVLAMRIEHAVEFFDNFANIRQRLQALRDVGLGYMTLGQSANTLSGGEAQRVKLAAELHRKPTEHTLYAFDEPTAGLHFADIRNLLVMLNRLTERGHSVVVIEHNLDVIASADWVIDLGPDGGDGGGTIVVEGTPEQVVECEASHTGRFLKKTLARAATL